jgi:DNA topoisomerase-3
VLDGFTARDGRTYRGRLELDREAWGVKVRSEGWAEGENANANPEYEVNTEPLGRCPREEDCKVIESPSFFICERKLKEDQNEKDESLPKSCGFQFPRTVCKREITREEALVYLSTGRTELLTDFTSRFGRPFSATLVLKETGRHGFEFPPRAPRAAKGAAKAAEGDAEASASAASNGDATPARPRRAARARGKAAVGGAEAGSSDAARPKAAAKGGRRTASAKPSRAGATRGARRKAVDPKS